ncbi:unnamed protein product [Pylaiella littoralis]
MSMALCTHTPLPAGGAVATAAFLGFALFAQTAAFVPGAGRLPISHCTRSSCSVFARGALRSSSSSGSRRVAAAGRSRRGGGGSAAGRAAPIGMMFDTLAENMAGVANLFTGQKTITESSVEGALKEVRRSLLDADVNLKVTNRLVDAVKAKAVGMKLIDGVTPEQQFVKIMNDELVEIMGAEQAPLARRTDGKPTVILLAGLQGTGKTTAAAKLAKYLKQEEEPKKVLLVAGDIYRPAAVDQLISLGERIDVEVFSMGQGVDPVEITKAGLERAVEGGFDTVIVDTAGRQVVDDTLMTELKNIQVASEADEVLLVVDAMTGQEAATLASVFNEKIGITGAVLTKMDGDTRGGAALSVQGVSQKPIKFVGVGEKLDDLEPFYPDRMASRILGMGDVVTLVEKAQKEGRRFPNGIRTSPATRDERGGSCPAGEEDDRRRVRLQRLLEASPDDEGHGEPGRRGQHDPGDGGKAHPSAAQRGRGGRETRGGSDQVHDGGRETYPEASHPGPDLANSLPKDRQGRGREALRSQRFPQGVPGHAEQHVEDGQADGRRRPQRLVRETFALRRARQGHRSAGGTVDEQEAAKTVQERQGRAHRRSLERFRIKKKRRRAGPSVVSHRTGQRTCAVFGSWYDVILLLRTCCAVLPVWSGDGSGAKTNRCYKQVEARWQQQKQAAGVSSSSSSSLTIIKRAPFWILV